MQNHKINVPGGGGNGREESSDIDIDGVYFQVSRQKQLETFIWK